MTAAAPKPDGSAGAIVYVSWGGTGRAAALRGAMRRADETGRRLVYLAILDDTCFGDIDQSMLELAKDELAWLLDAQLELAQQQARVEDVPVQVVVRSGNVLEQILDVVGGDHDDPGVDGTGVDSTAVEVLIGAPVPTSDDGSIDDLISAVSRRLGTPVGLVGS